MSDKGRSRRMTDRELRIIEEHYKTHPHKQIAEMIGRSHHCVRNWCSKKGWVNRDNRWSAEEVQRLVAWYSRPGGDARDTLRLQEFADSVGRLKTDVCSKARKLGLTRTNRRIETREARARLSDRAKRMIAERGHPRGALGIRHSPQTRAILSRKSRQGWAEIRKRPLLALAINRQAVRTKIERYGTASPVQWVNNGQNVYSRCRRGVREDLGFFVRSRWEANYARYLKWLHSRGDIAAWEYEPVTFRFEGVNRGPYTYKPDFRVVERDGTEVFHEVKGWMDPASRGKLKRFATFYPDRKLIVVDNRTYRSIERKVSTVIPHWEHA